MYGNTSHYRKPPGIAAVASCGAVWLLISRDSGIVRRDRKHLVRHPGDLAYHPVVAITKLGSRLLQDTVRCH